MGEGLQPLKPPRRLTPEEEVVLLAEFGARGPYDDLFSFPAASNFVFGYGGRDVFLTDAAGSVDEKENEGVGETILGDAANAARNIDYSWPIECLALRHTKVLSSHAATLLWNNVTEVSNTSNVPSLVSSQCNCNRKRSNDELLVGVLGIVDRESRAVTEKDETFLQQSCSCDACDAQFVDTIDSLLQEAEVVLSRRRPYVDPSSEASLLDRQRAVEGEDCRWVSVCVDIDKDDCFTRTEEFAGFRDDEKEGIEASLSEERKCLFAFEYGPTMEEQQILHEWDKAVVRCEKQLEAVLHETVYEDIMYSTNDIDLVNDDADPYLVVPPPIESGAEANTTSLVLVKSQHLFEMEEHASILESIAKIETRDSELQTAANERVQQADRDHRVPYRVPPGELQFDAFVERVDLLLPPNEVEVHVRSAVVWEEGVAVSVFSLPDITICPKTLSVEKIKKNAEREIFLVHRQALEERCMQEEDRKATCELQWHEEQSLRIQHAIRDCTCEENVAYDRIVSEELVAYQQLLTQEKQHVFMRRTIEGVQLMYVNAQLTSDVMREYLLTSSRIMMMEEDGFKVLTREACCTQELFRHTGQQKKCHIPVTLGNWCNFVGERDPEKRRRKAAKRAVLQTATTAATWQRWRREGKVETPPAASIAASSITGEAIRLEVLVREERLGREWLHACSQAIGNTIESLTRLLPLCDGTEKEGRKKELPRRVHASFSSRPGSACSASARDDVAPCPCNDADICLNAGLAKRLQPLIFGTAITDVREVAQLCHSVSFALEQITTIDFSSLSSLEVLCVEASNGSSGTKHVVLATPFVRELDLGGNALVTLPLDDLLQVFPTLQSLNLSDNSLKSLTCRVASMRGISEVHAHSVAQAAQLTRLNVSMNDLQSVEVVGKLLSHRLRTLIVYANHIESLMHLAQCTQLERLEASRNRVTSLSELQHLHFLQTLDLTENCIETWDALAQHVMLQNLYLSRNRIHVLPQNLSLFSLRQLFMNENRLEVLPAEAFRWLPLLSVVHMENNKLRNISGLAHCPRLTTVSLSFNQLQRLDDLLPLAACKRLQTLSVGENPFAIGSDEDEDLMPLKVRRTLLAWFPHLCELNNEKVLKAERQDAAQHKTFEAQPFCVAHELQRQQHENVIHGAWCWPCCSNLEAVQCVCGALNSYSRYKSPMKAYEEMFVALASDAVLTGIQREQDVLATVCRRSHHDALHVEDELQQRLRESKRHLNPVVHRLSDKVEERNRNNTMRTILGHLEVLQAMPHVQGNIHTRNVLYHERARIHKEAQAKLLISAWLYLCLLGKRARKELKLRRAKRLEEQRHRNEAAARIIQPVWRGAALRSRLKRILHPGGDDDDEKFTAVSLDFLNITEPASAYSSIGTVIQNVLQAHGTLPDLPVTSPTGYPFGTFDGPSLPRPSSSLPSSVGRWRVSDELRPESQPQRIAPKLQQLPSSPPSLNEEGGWGTFINSQLRKKQKKLERARRENLQRDLITNPLRVKHELGGR